MWVSRYFVLFIIYSCIGWVYETIFTTVSKGKWQNRGFLYGPICPIYGVGAVLISVIYVCVKDWTGHQLPVLQIFVVAVVGSAVLEYVTSITLEKIFHAVWWDYSELPFNLEGRISLFTSIGFGFAGIFVVKVLAPFVEGWVDIIPVIIIEVLSLIFMGMFGADLAMTATALIGFAEMLSNAQDELNEHMELLVRKVHRPAILRVTSFRLPNVDVERLEIARSHLKQWIEKKKR